MSLTATQQNYSRLIYAAGLKAGLSPARARELVAAAYAESGLRPDATNKSSGAAGFFQLLSSGYRRRAQQLGGLYDPIANTQAILPSYVKYWQQHPNAAPGEGGRDVERSGMGADFYSRPLGLLAGLGGAGQPATALSQSPAVAPGAAAPAPDNFRSSLARALAGGGEINWVKLARARQAPQFSERPTRSVPPDSSAPGSAAPGGLAEAFYDPLGSYDNGHFGKAIGGHSDHVHLSITSPKAMIAAIKQARNMGLRVGENPYTNRVNPVHVKGSFHYRDFPGTFGGRKLGEAIDVSGDPKAMAAYYKWATRGLR